ncbi:MAG: hypothetical protein AMXMBFR47_09180 [Planctomycetota bacterium]
MRTKSAGFTLIELLVVVAIIGLLLSILLPGLSGARDQAKRSRCLANLRSIGQASLAYASEDRREHVIPIHLSHVSSVAATGWTERWWWGNVSAGAWGGRSAQVSYPQESGATNVMLDPGPGEPIPPGARPDIWGAKTRPLNKFTYGELGASDARMLEVFHCPADAGFPSLDEVQDINTSDFSNRSARIPFYDLIGNSYRIFPVGMIWGTTGTTHRGAFTTGAWGHRLSSLQNLGRLILYTEPMFYSLGRQEAGTAPGVYRIKGWHNRVATDNCAFVDGSARSTVAQQLANYEQSVLEDMRYTDPNGSYDYRWFLRRGASWQVDCFPTPGALITRYDAAGMPMMTLDRANLPPTTRSRWPFAGYQENMAPPGE